MTYNSIKAKEHYQKNKNKIKLQQIEYLSRPGKKEHRYKKNQEWVKNHPEKMREYANRYTQNHKEELEIRRKQKRDKVLKEKSIFPMSLYENDEIYEEWIKFCIKHLSYYVVIRNWLKELYWNTNLSLGKIKRLYGLGHLHRRLFKWNISIPPFRKEKWDYYDEHNHCNLSQEAIEWINGELLGDGCLQLRRKSSPSAAINYTSKHFAYINYISDTLKSFGIEGGKIRGIFFNYKYVYYGYTYKSYDYIELLPIRKQWYPKGKKIVPKDIILTPLTCRQWYIGDGCLIQEKNRSSRISLSTCGFTNSDVEWLITKLIELDFKATKWKASNNIYITCSSVKKFLEYIGDCPVSCYKYKWNYIEYKKEHIPRLFEDRDWMYQKYVIEEISGIKIGILCGVTSRTIYNYLIKFDIVRRSNSESRKGPKIERICKTYGKKFYVVPSKANQKYHSRECQLKQYIGINNPNYRHGKYVKL